MNKTLLKTSFLAMLLIPFLNSCFKSDYEEIVKALARNVRWQDDNGIVNFTTQGISTELGFGTFFYENEFFEGRYAIQVRPRKVVFYPTNHEKLPFDNLAFDLKIGSKTDNNSLYLSLNGPVAKKFFKNNSYQSDFVIKKTQLTRDEIDAKYFFDFTWANETKKLKISKLFNENINTCSGTLDGFEISFIFLEDRRFSFTSYDGNVATGYYVSFENASITLCVEEGDALSRVGEMIHLSIFI